VDRLSKLQIARYEVMLEIQVPQRLRFCLLLVFDDKGAGSLNHLEVLEP
jgi:hypothetical protein